MVVPTALAIVLAARFIASGSYQNGDLGMRKSGPQHPKCDFNHIILIFFCSRLISPAHALSTTPRMNKPYEIEVSLRRIGMN